MSSRISEREVARRLAQRDEYAPPADLLARLKADIPAEIRVGGPGGGAAGGPAGNPEAHPQGRPGGPPTGDPGAGEVVNFAAHAQRRRPERVRWLMAASLAATLGAGILGYRLMDRVPSPEAALSVARPAEQETARENAAEGFRGREGAPEGRAAAPAVEPGEVPGPGAALRDEERQPGVPEGLAAERAEQDGGFAVPPPPPAPPVSETRADAPAEPSTLLKRKADSAAAPRAEPAPGAGAEQAFEEEGRLLLQEGKRRGDDDAARRVGVPPPAAPAPSPSAARKEVRQRDGKAPAPAQPIEGGVPSGVSGGAAAGSRPAAEDDGQADAPAGRQADKLQAHAAAAPQAARPRAQTEAQDRLKEEEIVVNAESPLRAPAAGTAATSSGAAGPRDRPDAETRPFIDAAEDRVSSFDLIAGASSYRIAQRYLREGQLPPPQSVRVEEFVSAFDYGDRPPERGDFALRAEGAPTPFAAGERYRLVRVSLRARAADPAKRDLVLAGSRQVVARDARVEVELDPRTVAVYRLLGPEGGAVAGRLFRETVAGLGEVFAGDAVTALYEVRLQPGVQPSARLATVRLRYRSVESGRPVGLEQELQVGDLARSWEQASPALRLAAVVARFAELLAGPRSAAGAGLDDLARRAEALSPAPGSADRGDVAELARLIARVRALAR